MVLVTASAEGRSGIGWTYGPAACAAVVRDELAPAVADLSAFEIPAALAAMVRGIRNAGRGGVAGYAISAVETALWDLKARLLDVPLCWLLGPARASAPVYASGGFTSYTDHELAAWIASVDEPRVKIKIGTDVSRVRLARDALGPDRALFVDANGAYRPKEAIRVGRELEEQGVTWFEEPVSSDDLAGLRRVREALSCDVTAGEYGHDLPYFRRMAGAVDCLQVDITRCGGVLEWQRAAAVAAAHGLEVSAHCAPQLHLHAALATPNLRHLEWFHDHVRIESMFFDGFREPEDGELRPDLSRPGLGLDLRTADAAKYLV
ncbi:MAG: mandelate racemase [Nonomuraea sp.]|nr:mandelate racemase [Nonomuraea sp.]